MSSHHATIDWVSYLQLILLKYYDFTNFSQVLLVKINFRYKKNEYHHDIAILKMNKKISFDLTKGPRPICLPESPKSLYIHTNGIIAGWGKTEVSAPFFYI